MSAATRSAQRCVIGPGATREAGDHAAQFGRRALVLGGTRAITAMRPTLVPSLEEQGIVHHLEQGDHVRKTRDAVERLAAVGREQRAELVIGCGGGAVMDCAKGVSHELGVPLINVPTTAGTNACGTAGAGIEGDSVPRRTWYQGADVILADTAVIARAGGRWLASGMGDALPSWFGAQLAARQGAGRISASRLAMARLCTDLILEHGARARRACERGEATPEVDRVVEAIVYCSGVAGFGLGGDHVLHPARIERCTRQAIHGEWVAFGFLVRVVLGGEFAGELPRLVAFLRSVALPTRFADFGLDDPTPDELLAEARRIVGPSGTADYGAGRPVGPEAIREAMLEVDYLGRTL
ncbi:MAG: iron-containing alcohol dehydrogenase [Chloroflexota bacterium]